MTSRVERGSTRATGNRFTTLVVLATVIGIVTKGQCEAQEARSPVFLLEPGMLTSDFISVPAGATSSTAFNLRFETRLQTGNRWITPVFGASIAPYGTSGVGGRNLNTPLIFAGNVLPVLSPKNTADWATIEAPILFYYSYDGGGDHNQRLYGRDLYVQLATRLHLGRKLLSDLGAFWSRVDGYLFLEQSLTPNRSRFSGRVDHFTPVALFGVVVPLGSTEARP